MIHIDYGLTPATLQPAIDRMWSASAHKLREIEASWRPGDGAPVTTVNGRYTSRGWTEWTQGFQFGSNLLQYDGTGDEAFLKAGIDATVTSMAPHVTHHGVHDHGFNNISTYGAILRLGWEGRLPERYHPNLPLCDLAIRASGAVQASRWSAAETGGYIYSFNGPHSLFADTMRSLRSLGLAHQLGHYLAGENDRRISLLDRLVLHARTTARYTVYYGEGRDLYDVPGRVAHESIFNTNDGRYRCPSTQQGYSPFTTWTRALAWVILGFAEEMEYLSAIPADDLAAHGGREPVLEWMGRAAEATARHYMGCSPTDGVPYWDTGAPGLAKMPGCTACPSDPLNPYEPVDSSAAAIAAQGLIRLAGVLAARGDAAAAHEYRQAGLTIARSLFSEPYLSEETGHQGLLLHSVYHRPNGWDHTPGGSAVPSGESSMWGDYHLRELALLIQRMATGQPAQTFFRPGPGGAPTCL